jgi:hypothetical protein
LLRGVQWLDRIERRLDWLHFPGLFKYLTFLGVIAFACRWARPDIAVLLDFDRDKILSGEVWRVFTFLFSPAGTGTPPAWSILLLFFVVQISFLISDSLESAWGATRLTLYILVAWLGLVAAQFVFDPGVRGAGTLLYTSLFLAFATLFPRVEFALFMVLPVQVRILGWISAVLLVLNGATNPASLVVSLPAVLPYFLWVLPDALHGRKSLVDAAKRRREFSVASRPEIQAFHRCESCGRTERDSADLQFFTLPDGKEFCEEHLPPQP